MLRQLIGDANTKFKGRDRNALCWCLSGKKYKKCHLNKGEPKPEVFQPRPEELKMVVQEKLTPPPPEDEYVIPHLSDLPPKEAEVIRQRYKENIEEHFEDPTLDK